MPQHEGNTRDDPEVVWYPRPDGARQDRGWSGFGPNVRPGQPGVRRRRSSVSVRAAARASTWVFAGVALVAAGALSVCLVLTSFGAALGPTGGADDSTVAATVAQDSATPLADASGPDSLGGLGRVQLQSIDAEITVADAQVEPPVIAERKIVAGTTAVALLATLPVKGKGPGTGYARTAEFGSAWMDIDRNGCDTRNDILARDLTADVMSGRCKVTRGTLADPYTGRIIHFVRGNQTSTLVQIDHVVALQNSWLTGARGLTRTQRVAFANDQLNLLAVDGRTNAVKGARDAATWLPPLKSFRCDYVTRQIEVKAKYRLWVAPAERDAMARVLGGCPGQPASRQKQIAPTP